MMDSQAKTEPLSYGLLLFPTFEVLDQAGPIEALNVLNYYYDKGLNLSIIAETMDPVDPGSGDANAKNRTFNGQQRYLPTHTFKNAPPLDVLIVPGGRGTSRSEVELKPMLDFIRDAYFGRNGREPLKYIFSICTGSALLARAGVLDGHRATTNKKAWERVHPHGPKTHWVAQARWVTCGNVWTTSGVSAGVDGMLQFIEEMYGKDVAQGVTDIIEYDRRTDSSSDPWAEMNAVKDVLPLQ